MLNSPRTSVSSISNCAVKISMSLSFAHGWCENPMVSRSGKGTSTKKA